MEGHRLTTRLPSSVPRKTSRRRGPASPRFRLRRYGNASSRNRQYGRFEQMADVHEFSDRVIDFAERLSNVADAAAGKRKANGMGTTRWLILPAAGAALYAVAKSDFVTSRAKGALDEATTRASELQNDLLDTVRQTSQKSSRASGGQRSPRTTSARKTKSAR